MRTPLERLSNFITRRPRTTWIIAAVLSLVMLPGLFRIRINNDYAAMLPENSKALKALQDLSDKLDGLGEFIVLLEGAPVDELAAFADRMLPEIAADPLVQRARYRTQTDYFEKRKFLYMPLKDLRKLVNATKRKIKEEHLKQSAFAIDLGVKSEAEETLDQIKRDHNVDDYFSYFTNKDRTQLILLVSPRAFPDDVSAAEHLYDLAEKAQAAARAGGAFDRIKVGYGGPYMENLYDHDILNRDIPRGGTLTGVLIFALLLIVYRSGWALLALVAPLALSILWCFSLAGFLLPEGLNSMSSFLGMILFGLGIDFSIHILNRYEEERRAGREPAEAVRIAVTGTGESCIYAAATSAAAFFLLAVAHFRGYTQFGLLAGMGVMISCLAILALLPALVVWLEEKGRAHFTLRKPRGRELYGRVADLPFRYLGPVTVLTLLLTVGGAFFAKQLRVDFDVSRLRPQSEGIQYVNAAARDILEMSSVPAVYAVNGKNEVDDVTQAIEAADAKLPDSVVLKIRSIKNLLPEDEWKKRELLQDLDAALLRERNLADDAEDIQEIDDFREEIQMPEVDEKKLPASVAEEFGFGENGYLVYLFGDHTKSRAENFAVLFSDTFGLLHGDLKDYRASGTLLVEAEILHHLLREGPKVMIYALMAVAVFVVILLRRPKLIALCLTTLFVGFMWAAGASALLGEHINVFNVVTLPAIIGLTVDYSIHILHRYQHEGPGSLQHVLENTGTSVWMAALTTIAGFAGLLPSHHGGLISLGTVAIAGIAGGVIALALFLPVMASLWERRVKVEGAADAA